MVLGCGGVWWYQLYARRTEAEQAEQQEQNEAEVLLRDKLFKKRQAILKFLSNDVGSVVENRMTVRQIMSRKLTIVPAKMPYDEVKRMMVEGRRHHLLVATNEGQLLGVISDRDLSKRVVPTAGDLMTREPLTASPTTMVGPAITLMLDRHISCLPVVEEGELVGVLTKSDLLMALQCILQVLNRNARETSAAEAPAQELAAAV